MRTVGYIPSETEAAEITHAGGTPLIPEGGNTPGRKKNHTPQKPDTGSEEPSTPDTSETEAAESHGGKTSGKED